MTAGTHLAGAVFNANLLRGFGGRDGFTALYPTPCSHRSPPGGGCRPRRHRPFRTREKRLRYTAAEGAGFEIPLRKLLRLARSPEAMRLTEERLEEWRSGRVSCRDAL